jgi:hypothetical protein
MYYRVAIRHDASTPWQWKSTTIASLTALFQFLRRYDKIAQDHLRVFSSPCLEQMEEQLAHENTGLGSCSVTAAQFRQEHMMSAQSASVVSTTASTQAHENGNGNHPARESVLSGRAAAGASSQTFSRGDFWNLMTLAKG